MLLGTQRYGYEARLNLYTIYLYIYIFYVLAGTFLFVSFGHLAGKTVSHPLYIACIICIYCWGKVFFFGGG